MQGVGGKLGLGGHATKLSCNDWPLVIPTIAKFVAPCAHAPFARTSTTSTVRTEVTVYRFMLTPVSWRVPHRGRERARHVGGRDVPRTVRWYSPAIVHVKADKSTSAIESGNVVQLDHCRRCIRRRSLHDYRCGAALELVYVPRVLNWQCLSAERREQP